jgi:hypothetical protein
MTRSSRLAATLVLTLAVPASLLAQEEAPAPPRSAAEVGAEGLAFAAAPATLSFGTSLGSAAGRQNTSSVQFVLAASAEKQVGTIALGWKRGNGNVQLELSGPLDGNAETEPLSLGGLARGASARLSVNRYGWRPPNQAEQDEAVRLCARLQLEGSNCTVRKLEASSPAESARLAELEHLNDKPWLFGGEASVTQRAFQFLQPATFDAASKNEIGFSTSARFGVFSPSLGFLFASYSYERDFVAAGRPSDICRPLGGSATLRCQMAVVGGPVDANQSVVSVELRRLLGPGSKAGLSPALRYDLEAESWLVDVPVYFVPGSGSVSGGVRFTWRSDTKDVTAVAFVGTLFELFGQ